jgi:predicted DNA-binding protein with PD1-like motif
MRRKLLHEQDGLRTFALVFETGEEVMAGLSAFARKEGLAAAQLSGIGALSHVTLGYFKWPSRTYARVELAEQLEVLSLLGGVALEGDAPKVHAHVVVGRADGTAHGGHLLAGFVRPTLEVVVTQTPTHLRRRFDPESGLALIDLPAS